MTAVRNIRSPLAALAGFAAMGWSTAAAPAEPGWRFWSGTELLRSCQSSFTGRVGCTSYLAGVIDNHESYAASGYGRRLFCPPARAKIGQFRAQVVAFLKAHPDSHGRGASGLTVAAMQAAYPCPRPGKPRRR